MIQTCVIKMGGGVQAFLSIRRSRLFQGSVRLIRTFLQRLPKRCENDRLALLGQTV